MSVPDGFAEIYGGEEGFEQALVECCGWVASVVEYLLNYMPPEPTLLSFKDVADKLTERSNEADRKKQEYWFVRTPANYVDILLEAKRKIVEVTEQDPFYGQFQQREAGQAGQN